MSSSEPTVAPLTGRQRLRRTLGAGLIPYRPPECCGPWILALIYIIIAAVLIACSADTLEASPKFRPVTAGVATLATVALYGLLIVATSRRVLRRVAVHAEFRHEVGRGYYRLISLHRLLMLIIYAAQIYVMRWPQFVYDSVGLRHVPLMDDILVLSPFLGMLVLSWRPMYLADKAVSGQAWNFGQYMVFQIRHYVAIVLVPWLLFVSVFDIAGWATDAFWPAAELMAKPYFAWSLATSMVLVLYVTAPLGLRYLWHTESLPKGELRGRLEGLCDRAKLRCRDILVWRTAGGRIANACIAGLWHKTRFIFLTDRLLWCLTPQETEAVFAHEIGHVKHRHMLYYLWFTANYVLFHTVVEDLIGSRLDLDGSMQIPVVFTTAICYWYLLFGFVSRRLEREADVFGVSMIGDGETFISSLEAISIENRARQHRRSWRHFSIANRIHFVRAMKQDIGVGLRFRRDMVCLHLFTLLVTVTCCGCVLARHAPWLRQRFLSLLRTIF